MSLAKNPSQHPAAAAKMASGTCRRCELEGLDCIPVGTEWHPIEHRRPSDNDFCDGSNFAALHVVNRCMV